MSGSINNGSMDMITPPSAYPFRLNTYSHAPDYDLPIEQFEEFAYARLQCMSFLIDESCLLFCSPVFRCSAPDD